MPDAGFGKFQNRFRALLKPIQMLYRILLLNLLLLAFLPQKTTASFRLDRQGIIPEEPSAVGIRVYGFDDGLTATTLYGVNTDRRGFVWINTNDGLFRYDGTRFYSHSPLSGNEVILTQTLNDTLLLAFSFDNSIDLINTVFPGRSSRVSVPDSLRLSAFAMSGYLSGDTLYIGTSDGRILRRAGTRWDESLTTNLPARIHVLSSEGDLLIAGSSGGTIILDKYTGELISRDSEIRSFGKPSFNNGVWQPVFDGIARFGTKGLETIYTYAELGITTEVSQVLWVSEQEFWIGLQGGGIRIFKTNETGAVIERIQLLNDINFTGLALGQNGTVWATSMNQGLFRFEPWFNLPRQKTSINDSPLGEVIRADSQTGSGQLIATRFNGLFFRNEGTEMWRKIFDERLEYIRWLNNESLLLSAVNNLFFLNPAGQPNPINIYLGDNLLYPAPIKQTHLREGHLAIASATSSVVIDADGDVLFFQLNRSSAIALTNDNMLINGKPNNLELVDLSSGTLIWEAAYRVNDIQPLDETRFLVMTASNGLLIFDTEAREIFQIVDIPGVSWNRAMPLGDDHFGVTGSMGFFIIQTKDLLGIKHDNTSAPNFFEIPLRPFGSGQTVRHATKSPDQLLISTGNGLIAFPWESIPELNPRPELRISRVLVGNREAEYNGMLELGENESLLTVELALTGAYNPLRYEILFGQDSQETRNAISQPQVQLAQIPAGSGTLHFTLSDRLTGTAVSELTLRIYKPPYWWETTFGRAMLAVALLFFGGLVVLLIQKKVQQRRLKRYEQADMMRKLERIAVTQLLTSHYMFNALTTIRTLTRRSSQEAIDYIGKFSRVIRALVDRSFDIDTDMASELEWVDDYLALEATNRGFEINFEKHIESGLDTSVIGLPSFTLQPIFENALVYGHKPEGKLYLRLDARTSEHFLEIKVTNSYLPGDVMHAEPNPESEGQPEADSIDKRSVGLELMQNRILNWSMLHQSPIADTAILNSRNTTTEWVTTICLPLIQLD